MTTLKADITNALIDDVRDGKHPGVALVRDASTSGLQLQINRKKPHTFRYKTEDGTVIIGTLGEEIAGSRLTPRKAKQIADDLRVERDRYRAKTNKRMPIADLRALATRIRTGVPGRGSNKHLTLAELAELFLEDKKRELRDEKVHRQNRKLGNAYTLFSPESPSGEPSSHYPNFQMISSLTVPQLTRDVLKEFQNACLETARLNPRSNRSANPGARTANVQVNLIGTLIRFGLEKQLNIGIETESESPTRLVRRLDETSAPSTNDGLLYYTRPDLQCILDILSKSSPRHQSTVSLAALFVLATGQRLGAVTETRAEDVHLDHDEHRMPNSDETGYVIWQAVDVKKTRGGRHAVAFPLSTAMREIAIRALLLREKKYDNHEYLFPSTKKGNQRPIQPGSVFARVHRDANTALNSAEGEAERTLRRVIALSAHDARGTFGNLLASDELELGKISIVLNHYDKNAPRVTQAFYNVPNPYANPETKLTVLNKMSDILFECGLQNTLDALDEAISKELARAEERTAKEQRTQLRHEEAAPDLSEEEIARRHAVMSRPNYKRGKKRNVR